ncbi:MAG: HIT family protein [Bacilli bacterium]|nr:HIT family protein [Bacilli bacterium]
MNHDDCVFCKIVRGELPSAKVYEDESVYAFLDISQVTEGHTLVIPKMHATDIYELPEDVAGNLFRPIPKIARAIKRAYRPIGINLLNNNEAGAGQTVFHIHIHIIPRYSGISDGFNVKWVRRDGEYDYDRLGQIAERIAKHMNE